MLRTTRTPLNHLATLTRRAYTASTLPRPASVQPSADGPTFASPPPAAPGTVDDTAGLKPQPFILRPLSRRYQLEKIAKADSHFSTTLTFVSPSAPRQPRSLTLPNLFLRDASIHPDHVHPASKQRLFRTTDIPLEGKLVGYGVHDVPGHGECLVTEWSTPITANVPIQSRKLSVVPVDFLAGIMKGDAEHAEREGTLPAARPWDRAGLERTLQRTPYDLFKRDDGALLQTLDALIKDGIVVLTGVPTEEKDGHETELRRVVERIGSLRRTWYGDLWDVRAVEGSRNIAYTNLDLGLHMDLTHFDNPPRYQFLHSLENTRITGGLSYFVDTFALASHLATHSPSTFSTLCTEDVLFSYRNGPHHTRFARPTFELVPGSTTTLHAVNYSPPFQGPLPLERLSRSPGGGGTESADADRLAELHDALGQFAALCDGANPPGSGPEKAREEKWRFEHQLEPGECVVFDNRRVLHARTGFSLEGEGASRWLKGAYMDGDEVWSRWRVLKAQQREKAAGGGGEGRGRTLFV
ncbi:hypothetical protein JCM10207_005876 [Rhodosporidiobolus poonsookiae]